MRHLSKENGIITAIPVANDVKPRESVNPPTPNPPANAWKPFTKPTMSITTKSCSVRTTGLRCLLNLTEQNTSSLTSERSYARLQRISAMLLHADAVTVSCPIQHRGKNYGIRHGFSTRQGAIIKEDLLVAPSTAAKKAMDTLKPVVLGPVRESTQLTMSGKAEGIRTQCIIPL